MVRRMKYKNTPSGGTELKTLIHRMALVKGYDVKIPVMYSKSGYDQSLEGTGDVELYTLDDVLGTIGRRGATEPGCMMGHGPAWVDIRARSCGPHARIDS